MPKECSNLKRVIVNRFIFMYCLSDFRFIWWRKLKFTAQSLCSYVCNIFRRERSILCWVVCEWLWSTHDFDRACFGWEYRRQCGYYTYVFLLFCVCACVVLQMSCELFTICGSVERVGQTMYIHGILSESFIYCEVAGFSSLRREACELKQSFHNIYLHCLIIEAINYALARF